MDQLVTLFITPVLVDLLPEMDAHKKLQLIIIINRLITGSMIIMILNYLKTLLIKTPTEKTITIQSYDPGTQKLCILYIKLLSYISRNHQDKILKCQISDGIILLINEINPITEIMTDENGVKHIIRIQDSSQNSGIKISSKTANTIQLLQYIKDIQTYTDTGISVYKPTRNMGWGLSKVKCAKTMENTAYSKNIEQDLFEDVGKFISSEEWYKSMGISYKRGYFLYSSPGQGKTSAVKIIARKYQYPIFNVDFGIVKDNETLSRLCADINQLCPTGYILLFEDIDRASISLAANSVKKGDNDNKITMDCLLNIIDGVSYKYGRILILTPNDSRFIQENKALCRPGRIDKQLKLENCDLDQIQRL